MSYEFVEYADREMLAINLAGKLAGELNAALRNRERALLAVPGGTTPGPIFDDLCAVALDWASVDVVLTDERWVPQDDPRSNTRLVRERLLTGPAAAARLLSLHDPAQRPEDAVDALAADLAPRLPISVLLLGMGTDLHCASLFPGGDNLEIALAPDAPLLVPMRAPGLTEPRLTLAAHVLDGALSKHLVIMGRDKREALEQAAGKSHAEAPVLAVLNEGVVHWAE